MFSGTGFIMKLILGAIAGWIASMIMGKDAQMGGVANVVVGILGAIIGGWIYDAFFLSGSANAGNFVSVIWAIIGAVILLAIINLVTGKNNNNRPNQPHNRPRR